MKLSLDVASDDGDVVILAGRMPDAPAGTASTLRYRTRTGALLRIDGVARGAFDREHETFAVSRGAGRDISLEVERRSLPASGLPPRDGFRWRTLLARSVQTPARTIEVRSAVPVERASAAAPNGAPLSLTGHSHLDVAWLWTYEEAARKTLRTFATAVRQLDADAAFVFAQSQPQLYAFLAERDPDLFARVVAFVRAGRIDASVAAMWVEPDCTIPSGESLLRQLVFGIRYGENVLGVRPSVAWLPDTFGFANTLPTLLAHAGIGAFATTKLGWNDTTRFPYARFRWEGPDGSAVLAASIGSIEGGFERRRVDAARARGDLLLIGLGDGGGGARDDALARAPAHGTWTTVAAWFERIGASPERLPVVRDELYLEGHRGVATTHHRVKARHAALERALLDAELSLAWAKTLRATPFFLDEAREQLAAAWEIVLRAEFHDVLPGTSVAPVYADAHREFDEAEALVANVARNARSVLPHVPAREREPTFVRPRPERDAIALQNDFMRARVRRRDGAIVDLRVPGGPNLVRAALRVAAYVDRPKRWDAWNVDRSYRHRPRRVRVTGCEATPDGIEIRYAFGASLAVARLELRADEPFVRFDLAVDWHERHVLLRVENRLGFAGVRARFGSPHGAVDRAPRPRSRAERAKFEAPGQRFARVDGARGGLALFARDTYGWSLARSRGATELGHSLLRGPTWPDPSADEGTHQISLALFPFAGAAASLGMGELERAWERFAGREETPMFACDDPAIAIVATKLADDGEGIVLRARECDGRAREVAIRCAARAFGVSCNDALERPVAGDATFEDGAIRARFDAFELRTFRVATAASKPS